jgi:hypothetical protein
LNTADSLEIDARFAGAKEMVVIDRSESESMYRIGFTLEPESRPILEVATLDQIASIGTHHQTEEDHYETEYKR